jgi:two-component sensor histidine kinase
MVAHFNRVCAAGARRVKFHRRRGACPSKGALAKNDDTVGGLGQHQCAALCRFDCGSQYWLPEALHDLRIDEINHRVKNTLATVQSLATQTFRDSADPALRAKFGARLVSLGRAHDVLSARKWEGADLRDVVNATLEPFASANPDRIITDGLSIPMSSRAVVMLSLVLHELATNAAKYGALSGPAGCVTVTWVISPVDKVKLHWRESDGPSVDTPQHAGFGSTLIEKGFAAQIGGAATLRFEPGGLICALEFPPH